MSNQVPAPTEDKVFEARNRLLAVLPERNLLSLQPYLESVPLAPGSILFDVDEPLERVYFMERGVASLVSAFENRITVGVSMVGREGAIGIAPLLLGGTTALGRSRVLVPGSALSVKVSAVWDALRERSTLRAACEAYTRALLVEMLQAVPCNRLHTAEQRCARWLLMCADRIEDDAFEWAPEPFAEMLGVPQSKLTAITRRLQESGLICHRGGAIAVLDRQGLETAACECYRIVRDRSERSLAPAFN
jgi:CRP-like cAMP-binding protein